MRTKFAYRNFISGILLQAVTAVYGLIIPQLFIREYGSVVNGLVSSITQIISCLGLVEMGLGAAGMVELYGALAKEDQNEINCILSDLGRFYRKSGVLFSVLVMGIFIIYPYIIQDEIEDFFFVRTMVLILSANVLSDFFFLDKYRILLMASQRTYIINFAQILTKTAVTVLTYLLIRSHESALFVKFSAVPLFYFQSYIIIKIVKNEYPFLNFNIKKSMHAFSQRKAAFVHQIMGMVCLNTDMVLLTTLSSSNALSNVSVYAVYDLVVYAVTSLVSAFTNSATAGFGQLMSQKDIKRIRELFSSYEFAAFMFIFWIYITMFILLGPFISIYTNGLPDQGQYIDHKLTVLFTLSGLIRVLRFPANTMIEAAGHYNNTWKRSALEGAINIILSIILIPLYGITGTLIGTIVAFLYRTIDVILYTNKHFLENAIRKTVRRLCVNMLTAAFAIIIIKKAIPPADTLAMWTLSAVLTLFISGMLIFIANLISEKAEMKLWSKYVMKVLRKE